MSANSQLTTAIHALCWIELAARQGESPITSERVAESLQSHPVLVRRVLAPLREAGILISGRGPGSGWRMTRAAGEVTLREVYAALHHDGPFALHAHEPKAECPVGHGIRPALTTIYSTIEAELLRELNRHTIGDLLDTILREYPLPATSP